MLSERTLAQASVKDAMKYSFLRPWISLYQRGRDFYYCDADGQINKDVLLESLLSGLITLGCPLHVRVCTGSGGCGGLLTQATSMHNTTHSVICVLDLDCWHPKSFMNDEYGPSIMR